MLTYEMIRVISLLKRIGSASRVLTQEDKVLADRLCLMGLVRSVSQNGRESGCYELTKPLKQISLCDVLRFTGGEVRLSFNEDKEIYDRYGEAGRRLGVTNYMVCRFLAEINLTEVVFPDSSLNKDNEVPMHKESLNRETHKI